ncbi:MAG: response regulator [Calditrichaceae bacterium]|nr:response regulator [Calditrichaceae bacterium]RQV95197.1 MAG: response regulator [Calditrichota bacterium]
MAKKSILQLNPNHVLVVDDEVDNLEFLKTLLQNHGYIAHSFLNAMDAVAFLNFTDKAINLILADIRMPSMDGNEFLPEVKKMPKYASTPFLFLSAINDRKVILDAYRAGAVDYITKPIDNEVFLAKIDALIQNFTMSEIKNNIILEGSESNLSIEEMITFCEQEKLNGFTFVQHEHLEGVFTFENGVLNDIQCDELADAEAFEKIRSWKKYSIFIVRGVFYPKTMTKYVQARLMSPI